MKYKPWMMKGIRASFQHKIELYLYMKASNDPNLKSYFNIKKFCLMLLEQPKILIVMD
jgi:hypothetical protein